jgi:hypothetical protein
MFAVEVIWQQAAIIFGTLVPGIQREVEVRRYAVHNPARYSAGETEHNDFRVCGHLR